MALARSARAKHLRVHAWTREMPTHWNPTGVMNPVTGMVFTDVSAWEFIAALLEDGYPMSEVVLDQPPGAIGYVMIVPLADGTPDLYIKLHPYGGGRVYGRSFHYSER